LRAGGKETISLERKASQQKGTKNVKVSLHN